MRFVVIGAGAIGGVVGARLHEHGHDVVLVARGRHLDAIRADGLRLDSPDGSVLHRVHAVGTAGEAHLARGDVVLLAVKSQDTEGALDQVSRAAPVATPIVCLQNGVANERAALRRFPNVYGCCVMCPTAHLEPGVVEAHSAPVTGLLDLGRYPRGVDDLAESVAAAFAASTFRAVARRDVMAWKYQKLLMNLGNAVQALCGSTDGTQDVVRRAIREAIECFAAHGIEYVSREADAERRGDLLQIRGVGGRQRGGGSTWQSLARGSGVETDYLNGEIVLLGRLRGVATPVNAALQRLVRERATRGDAPGSMTAGDLAAALESTTTANS